jgi:predicted ATP-dependent serine protease
VPLGRRPWAAVDSVPEVATARDLVRRAWTPLVSTAYPELRLGRGALIVAVGAAGAGKSTWATRFQAGLPGPKVYVSFEEGLSQSVADRLSRLGIHDDDYFIVAAATIDQIVELGRRVRARSLCVDSLQRSMFTAAEARHLLHVLDLDCVIATAQVNADGEPAGRRELLHEADACFWFEAMRWRIAKSRFANAGQEGTVGPCLA